MLKAIAFAAAVLAAGPALAAVETTPDGVEKALADKDTVVLFVGDKAEYDAGHIKGARYVAGDALSVTGPNGLVLEMPAPEDLKARLEKLGVSDDSRIVVVYGQGRLPPATRVLVTLRYAGFGDRSMLLDGGMAAWKKAGKPVTAEASPATPGKIARLNLQDLVVDADYVRAHLSAPGYAVVDARATAFYDGSRAGGSAAAPQPKGHIQGAKSVPFDSVADSDGSYKASKDLAAQFQAAGIKPGDTVIAYCHVGQQATVVMTAAQIAGIKAVLYDGSYQDWSQKGLPVDGPAN